MRVYNQIILFKFGKNNDIYIIYVILLYIKYAKNIYVTLLNHTKIKKKKKYIDGYIIYFNIFIRILLSTILYINICRSIYTSNNQPLCI